jgi:DNA primase
MTSAETTPGGDRGSYSLNRSIKAIKQAVTIQDYLKERGIEIRNDRTTCPIHTGATNPTSFQIDPTRQRWQCHSCGDWGDIIDLVELVERHADTWTAIVSLSMRFNVDLPERPPEWYEWQGEKARRRKMLRAAIATSYQRRFFRLFSADIETIEDPHEREEEARALWESIRPLAVSCAERRLQA